MNILFLIGNGFDLNLGMRTSYNNFYEYYKIKKSKNNLIIELKNNISNNINNWSDLELALGKYTERIKNLEEFDEIYQDIEDNLADFLIEEENAYDFNKINNKKLYEYLAFPERSLLKADNNELINYKNTWSKNQWIVNIVTFNYTRTIEKIINDKINNLQINLHHGIPIILQGIEHIHGYIDENMVMGVNDVNQISNIRFRENQDIIEALVKTNCNQANKHTIDEIFKNQIIDANLICIFGSSIGETDKFWWNLIGNQLKRNCKLIIFQKTNEISPRRTFLKQRIERDMKNYFLNKTELSEVEKNNAKKNIYVGINTNMFKLI